MAKICPTSRRTCHCPQLSRRARSLCCLSGPLQAVSPPDCGADDRFVSSANLCEVGTECDGLPHSHGSLSGSASTDATTAPVSLSTLHLAFSRAYCAS